jgi:2,3-bisphosphoglycerate-independent phosphoglycerate mutase
VTDPVRHVICVPDGCADEPLTELGGRTPLEAARMPTLARLAARARLGRARTIPVGTAPNSDVGLLAILGYDPARFHAGRAPIEAAGAGVEVPPGSVVFRCNLVTIGADGTMVDFAGGHPAQPAAEAAIERLNARLGGVVTFHPGRSYRHLALAPLAWADAVCTPPHELTGAAATMPDGPGGDAITDLIRRSRDVLAEIGLPATHIWLWGQGRTPELPPFALRHGIDGAVVTAFDVMRGLAVLAGLRVVTVPGATGWYDTDFEGKRDAALAALADGAGLVLIHVESTDEAGHAGDAGAKVQGLEFWDARLLTGLTAELDRRGAWRMLFLPDHPTSTATRRHTADPVPYLLFDSRRPESGGRFTERAVAGAVVEPAHTLVSRLLSDGQS